jgi:hypothetical protein
VVAVPQYRDTVSCHEVVNKISRHFYAAYSTYALIKLGLQDVCTENLLQTRDD